MVPTKLTVPLLIVPDVTVKELFTKEKNKLDIEYTSCPYCYGKNIEKVEVGNTIVIKCKDCANKIDILPKKEAN